MANDTIFALATAPGRAAVAVVRISGPGSRGAVAALAGRMPGPRRASLRSLRARDGEAIDEALVLWFPGPRSYTGEDCAEFQLHGGVAVIEALQVALLDLGLRPAEPGEFTRRAFENGKLDLAQAEGVADLIDAETAAQAKQALAQVGGALSERHETWRAKLVEALAMLEANVDFPDEDLPEDLDAYAGAPLVGLITELEAAVGESERGQRVREGYRIALIGAPNAGKSSLLNVLAGREAAIVTDIAGTTRDIIEVPMVIAGYRVLMADTAGLREANDEIEAEGVRRARAWASDADLRVWVIEGGGDLTAVSAEDLVVFSKADLAPQAGEGLNVSSKTGLGIAELREVLQGRVVAALQASEFPAATRARHAVLLNNALKHLRRAMASLRVAPELAAEDVRLAGRALGRVTGKIDPEDVLNQVFAKFCIGK